MSDFFDNLTESAANGVCHVSHGCCRDEDSSGVHAVHAHLGRMDSTGTSDAKVRYEAMEAEYRGRPRFTRMFMKQKVLSRRHDPISMAYSERSLANSAHENVELARRSSPGSKFRSVCHGPGYSNR